MPVTAAVKLMPSMLASDVLATETRPTQNVCHEIRTFPHPPARSLSLFFYSFKVLHLKRQPAPYIRFLADQRSEKIETNFTVLQFNRL